MSAQPPPDPDRQPPTQPPSGQGSDAKGTGDGGPETGAGSAGSDSGAPEPSRQPPGRPRDEDKAVAPPTPFTQQLGRIAIVVIAALFAVFAIANSQPVDFSWVFGETTAQPAGDGAGTAGGVPLILLLLGAFVVGALVTMLTERYVSRSRRARKAAKQRRDSAGKTGD